MRLSYSLVIQLLTQKVLYSKGLSAFYTPYNASWITKNHPQVICPTSRIGGQGAFAEILYRIHLDYKENHGTSDNRFSEPQQKL